MNKENKENLKWILRFVVLAAIISYGSSVYTHGTNNKFRLLSSQQSKDVKEMITVFPEAIRYTIKYRNNKEYWDNFKLAEEINPSFVGGLILQLEDICTSGKDGGLSI
jgi:hypothetical protein